MFYAKDHSELLKTEQILEMSGLEFMQGILAGDLAGRRQFPVRWAIVCNQWKKGALCSAAPRNSM